MLFTWDTKDLCIVFRQWHIRSTTSLVFSLLAVVLLAIGYEGLRSISHKYELKISQRIDALPRKFSLHPFPPPQPPPLACLFFLLSSVSWDVGADHFLPVALHRFVADEKKMMKTNLVLNQLRFSPQDKPRNRRRVSPSSSRLSSTLSRTSTPLCSCTFLTSLPVSRCWIYSL